MKPMKRLTQMTLTALALSFCVTGLAFAETETTTVSGHVQTSCPAKTSKNQDKCKDNKGVKKEIDKKAKAEAKKKCKAKSKTLGVLTQRMSDCKRIHRKHQVKWPHLRCKFTATCK